MDDPFLQENGTLKNKLGITDPDELEEVSYKNSAKKSCANLAKQF